MSSHRKARPRPARRRTKETTKEAPPVVVVEDEQPKGPRPVTAGWPLGRIVEALARAGWGPFTGRYYGATRAILSALGSLLGASGQGMVTAGQIADAAGYSDKWVFRKLAELEEAGVLTWQRGGIENGRPAPGFIRVSKQQLADVVNRAREVGNPKALERARETAQRIAAAGLRFTKRALCPRRTPTTGTEAAPSPLKREDGGLYDGPPATGTMLNKPRPPVGRRWAAVKAAMEAHKQATGALVAA